MAYDGDLDENEVQSTLRAFSHGDISKWQAIFILNLNNYYELLDIMNQFQITFGGFSTEDMDEQVRAFADMQNSGSID